MKNLYVAATSQHVGKTTTTLGLVANLIERGLRTGYCKPVGQQHITINGITADKDAVLFSEVTGFDIIPELHSPVIIGQGVTKNFQDHPEQYLFEKKILAAEKKLNNLYDVVVYEGTGHPGVGSIVNLSNARVAKILDAGVIMVVEGGIGSTIDMLNMCTALFREENVPIIGVIVNKVKPEKMAETGHYLQRKLDAMGYPLLGLLPYEQSLSLPIMEMIRKAVDGKVLINEDCMNNKVEDIIAGSLVDVDEFHTFENILLVTSSMRINQAIEKVESVARIKNLKTSPLSGVIVTSDGRHHRWLDLEDLNHPYFSKHKIPVISTTLDTYGSVVKITRIEVKINNRTPWKTKRAVELFHEHVNFEMILKQLNV